MGGHRGEDVTPGEGRPGRGRQVVGLVGQGDRPAGASDHAHRAGQQAVVRADEDRLPVLPHLDGHGPAQGADARVDHGQDDAGDQVLDAAGEGQRAGPHVAGGHLVRDVDDGGVGRDRPDDRLDDTDELVSQPVVRQERDRVVATTGAAVDQPAWV